uniref:G_PROTEIN_RECEP_F1_2 domain-containing protein n=1 Tax=Steinernema glaseri TaxID=37863 RepID=A0A1I7ZY56_9BILA
MQSVSYFILNELLWSLTGNLLYTLGHPLPMMPAMCFRMDGLAGSWLKTDEQRSMYLLAVVFSAVNCCIGIVTTFIFRYITIAFRKRISQLHKGWCYLFCITPHLMLSLLIVILFRMWMIPVSEYPENNLPEDTQYLFCFRPGGTELLTILFLSILFYGGATVCIAIFAGLCVRELRINRHVMEKTTLSMQKEVLKNLMIITGASVCIGSLPLFIYTLFACNPRWPFARTVSLISMLFPLNHGTVYAVLIFYLFKPYRKAIADMAMALKNIRKGNVGPVGNGTLTNVVFKRVTSVRY